jgi:hypothetical protein
VRKNGPSCPRLGPNFAFGHVDQLWFAWDNGGTGTMTLRWSGDLIAELTVAFS